MKDAHLQPETPVGRRGPAPRRDGSTGRGFTLVEILIVMVILGILAAIVIPQMSNASQTASESTLKEDLRIMRTQIQIYRFQHMEVMPGRLGGGWDANTFAQQMTLCTDMQGDVAAPPSTPAFPYGPYFSKILVNPLNNKGTVQVIAGLGALPAADNSDGWMYQPETSTFVADSPGSDLGGVAYVNY